MTFTQAEYASMRARGEGDPDDRPYTWAQQVRGLAERLGKAPVCNRRSYLRKIADEMWALQWELIDAHRSDEKLPADSLGWVASDLAHALHARKGDEEKRAISDGVRTLTRAVREIEAWQPEASDGAE